jgi:hypothetical protein
MKTLALFLALGITTAVFGGGRPTDDLVAAAKASKEKKKKSTTKVITNADVKKAKAQVAETKVVAAVDSAPRKNLVDDYEKSYHDRLANEERLAVAKRTVAGLERDLGAAEQAYFEENDLDRRDTEVVKRFNDTKAKLEQARKELASLTPPAQ